MTSQQFKTVNNIQYLRFLAASLVVLHHAVQLVSRHSQGDAELNFEIGASGVDMFFAISGFIMCVITERTERSPLDFILHRFARVAPMYWVLTVLMSVGLILAPHLFASSKFSPDAFIASLFFFPWRHSTLAGAMPILQIGWTLNFEFFFYMLFAIGLAISPRRRVGITTALLLTAVIAGFVFQPVGVQAQFYTSSILLEFVFGMGIAKLFVNRSLPGPRVAVGLALIGILSMTVMSSFPISRLDPLRPFLWGIPNALIVLGAVSLEGLWPARTQKHLRKLGDASYSIYLTHLFTLGMVGALWSGLHLGHTISDLFLIVAAMGASLSIGVIVYQYGERKLSVLAKSLVEKSPSLQKPDARAAI